MKWECCASLENRGTQYMSRLMPILRCLNCLICRMQSWRAWGGTITVADVTLHTAHFYHGIYFSLTDWIDKLTQRDGCFVSASWETLWCQLLHYRCQPVWILHFHAKANSHFSVLNESSFFLCMVRLDVLQGNTVFLFLINSLKRY